MNIPHKEAENKRENGDSDAKASVCPHVVPLREPMDALRCPETQEQVVGNCGKDALAPYSKIDNKTVLPEEPWYNTSIVTMIRAQMRPPAYLKYCA